MKKDKMKKEDDGSYDAKMGVLKELRQTAMDMMGDKVRDKMPHKMKEVSVMAPDAEGLKKGLDVASHVLPDAEEGADERAADNISNPGLHHAVANMMNPKDEVASEGEPDYADSADLDEIESMIQELMDRKNELIKRP